MAITLTKAPKYMLVLDIVLVRLHLACALAMTWSKWQVSSPVQLIRSYRMELCFSVPAVPYVARRSDHSFARKTRRLASWACRAIYCRAHAPATERQVRTRFLRKRLRKRLRKQIRERIRERQRNAGNQVSVRTSVCSLIDSALIMDGSIDRFSN